MIFVTAFCALNSELTVNAYEDSNESIIDNLYTEVNIEDDFDEKSIVVVLDKNISNINKVHNNTLFSHIDYKAITDLTYVNDLSTIKDESNFEQIFQIDLLHSGKENVISTIEHLKTIPGIKLVVLIGMSLLFLCK